MKIIFTGVTGLLGGYFLKTKDQNFETVGVSSKDFNISDSLAVRDFVKSVKPSLIIHAASLGNVDYCEKNPDQAFRVNVEGTQNIIDASKEVKAKIIFLSSNAIYDGTNPPYDEKSPANPLDVYGKTKVEGERLIKESGLDFVILRLITMYGWPSPSGRGNPVTWVIEKLKNGEKINVVNDVYNNHLYAYQATEVLWKIIKMEIKNDLFNIGGGDCISRFDLALKVAQVFKLDSSLITPVGSDFFKDLAKRPKNTCFNTQKMEKDLDIKSLNIDEGLRLMKLETNTQR